MNKLLFCVNASILLMSLPAAAQAWEDSGQAWEDTGAWGSEEFDSDECAEDCDENDEVEAPALIVTSGRFIYLVCIYGDRDTHHKVPKKCTQIKGELEKAYPGARVIRVNNPTEPELKRINDRKNNDIAFVIVVTHSTHGDEEGEWDVWDCEMQPEDIAGAFEDEWVIWNGCYSLPICEEAANLLPVQSEAECLAYSDETWRRMVWCIGQTEGRPVTREEICKQVFKGDW